MQFTAFDFRMRIAIVRTNFIFRHEEWDTLTAWVVHLPGGELADMAARFPAAVGQQYGQQAHP